LLVNRALEASKLEDLWFHDLCRSFLTRAWRESRSRSSCVCQGTGPGRCSTGTTSWTRATYEAS